MKTTTLILPAEMAGQNDEIRGIVEKERGRLLGFIRNRVPEDREAEDILQDVFYQFVETYRMVKPIEHVTAWLYTVARNRITDMFRKKKEAAMPTIKYNQEDGDKELTLADLLPADNGDAVTDLFRESVMEEIRHGLDELPKEQRDVFVWHEIEGRSFKEIEEMTGVGVNTLSSRKRYAILYLRSRLQGLYNELLNA